MPKIDNKPHKRKLIRKGLFAYQYPNGTVEIDNKLYPGSSMTSAIKSYRKNNPIKKK